LCLLIIGLAGCGGATNAPPATAEQLPEPPAAQATTPPAESVVAVNDPAATTASTTEAAVVLEEGSPEWNLQEIQNIRLLPFPSVELPQDDDMDADSNAGSSIETTSAETPAPDAAVTDAAAESPGDAVPAEATKTPSVKEQLAQTRALRRERNQQIVNLAMKTIAQTAKDPAQQALFEQAVTQFLDAHLQLALQGDETSISALYEAAEAFHAKKADSASAASAQLTLVNLAHANALRYAETEPRWLQEFARHAQLYATRFPQAGDKGIPLLFSAGRSCELHGLSEEAKACFSLLQQQYPESPQAAQVAGILRRMQMLGKPIEFVGPTIDGNEINLSDFQGQKTVVIIFWATHAQPFVEAAPQLKAITDKYKKYAQVISVSLDTEEPAIDQFLEQSQLTWPVIFHPQQNQRGWNAPLASYYGVSQVPTIWIVDLKGAVAKVDVTAKSLESDLREVILKYKDSTPAAAEGAKTSAVQPAGATSPAQ
jgi:peroxiredoxin